MADITAGSVNSKKKKKISIFPIVNCIIMVLFLIITLYPVLNTLAISLNDGTDALRGGIYLLPRKFTWKNYITVLQKNNQLIDQRFLAFYFHFHAAVIQVFHPAGQSELVCFLYCIITEPHSLNSAIKNDMFSYFCFLFPKHTDPLLLSFLIST